MGGYFPEKPSRTDDFPNSYREAQTGNSGKDWNIAVWDDNNIRCSCPVNKIKKQECHHVKAVQMYLTSVRTGWRMW